MTIGPRVDSGERWATPHATIRKAPHPERFGRNVKSMDRQGLHCSHTPFKPGDVDCPALAWRPPWAGSAQAAGVTDADILNDAETTACRHLRHGHPGPAPQPDDRHQQRPSRTWSPYRSMSFGGESSAARESQPVIPQRQDVRHRLLQPPLRNGRQDRQKLWKYEHRLPCRTASCPAAT